MWRGRSRRERTPNGALTIAHGCGRAVPAPGATWLDKHLKEHENEYGEIQLPKSAAIESGGENDSKDTSS